MMISTAYPSLLGGVSQQAPEQRGPGQHAEQINMVSDPVRGLTRRQGTLVEDTLAAPGQVAGTTTDADARNFRRHPFRVEGEDVAVFARYATKTGGSTLADIYAINQTTKEVVPVVRPAVDAALDTLLTGGVAASAPLGRFLLLSGNTLAPTFTTTEKWTPEENQKRHVIWVRGGAYSRPFRMILIRGNQKFYVEYTTLAASYPSALDTSDLLATDPDYLNKVNDRTNEYNSAVTQWIGLALADSTPENIANRLADELRASSFLSPSGTVRVEGSTVCITDPSIEEVSAEDGGDGSLIRAVGNEVAAAELLSLVAYPGKVVKIRPQSGDSTVGFYVKALPKDASEGDFTEVSWEECAGVEYQPTGGLCFATLHNDQLAIAGSPQGIRDLTGLDFPDYMVNVSGDAETNPPPEWLTRGATALGVFQDRLIIGAQSAVNSSRAGDYLNFFRASVVTSAADDPVNFTVIGGEDDILRKTLIYDRNLVLFGDRQQYVIDGRQPFVPGRTSATIMSPVPNASAIQPVSAENYMFYVKGNGTSTSLHRFRPGTIDENPVVQELSEGLDSYMPGKPVDMVVHNTPNFVFVKTDGSVDIFVYQFEDYLNGENKQRSWHRWRIASTLGSILGVSAFEGELLVLRVQAGVLTLDSLLLQTDDTGRPYLDGMNATTGTYVASGSAGAYVGGPAAVSASVPSPKWFGELMDQVGILLTRPLFRDEVGVIGEGVLTINRVRIMTRDTGGLTYQLRFNAPPSAFSQVYEGLAPETPPTVPPLALDFGDTDLGTWRTLDTPASADHTTELVTNIGIAGRAETFVPIYADSRDYSLAIGPYIWAPLTITHVEFTGNYYSNTKRV